MSVTICWKPTSKADKHFNGGTSSDLSALEKTFGNEIDVQDVPTLRAMARASGNEFYDEVADQVEKVGRIKFWGEY